MSVSSTVFTDVIESRHAGYAAGETPLFPVDRPMRHGHIMKIFGRIRNPYLC
jgi:hypothetical protein